MPASDRRSNDLPAPTAFEAHVIAILANAVMGHADAGEVRRLVSRRIERDTGRKPHQAAIACNLTKLAWNGRYIAGATHGRGYLLLLTDAGKKYAAARNTSKD
jgi:hypothetical protein